MSKPTYVRNQMNRKRKRIRPALLVTCMTIAGLSLTGCSLMPQEEAPLAPPLVKPQKVPYTTVTVSRQSIENDVTGTANFDALKQINLSFKNPPGRLTDVLVKPGQMVHKGQILLEADTFDLDFQLSLAKIALEKDQLTVDHLNVEKADTYQKQSAELDVQADTAKVNYLQNQVNQGRIVSPIDGIVTNLTSHKIGDLVNPYENLVSISDIHQLVLKYVAIDPSQVEQVVDGMHVDLTYQGKHYSGSVVEKIDDPNGNGTTLMFAMNELPPGAKMGDSADFKIVTERKDNVLVIPKDAVGNDFGDVYVRVLKGPDDVQEVSVQTGLETGTEVEITQGLKQGEKVIMP